VFVAPLRYGAGVKGKILTAFAHGVPVVTTPVGAEGIGEGLALVAEDEAEFAEKILALHRDEALWTRLSQAAIAYIAEEHSLEADVRAMREVLALAG
jgi:glycosyltransferase involved in cell wall biosynthesis